MIKQEQIRAPARIDAAAVGRDELVPPLDFDGICAPDPWSTRTLRAIATSAPALSAPETRTEYIERATQSSASTNPIQRPCATFIPAFRADDRPPFGFEIRRETCPRADEGFDNFTCPIS